MRTLDGTLLANGDLIQAAHGGRVTSQLTFHFKDGPHYLGEGNIKLQSIADSVRAIDYRGWIVLETSCPSGNPENDCRRNTAVVRKLFNLPEKPARA